MKKKKYLIILQVWFLNLEKQRIELVEVNSHLEAEAIAERRVREMKGWSGHKTHWIVLRCSYDSKPLAPGKAVRLTLKERLLGWYLPS